MHIDKWHRHVKLFVWQHKRSMVLTAMFVAALVLNIILSMPAASSTLSLIQWPLEFWLLATVGFFICVAVVVVND